MARGQRAEGRRGILWRTRNPNVAKVGVEGSNPFAHSIFFLTNQLDRAEFCNTGKTPGTGAFFVCWDTPEYDSSYA
jgi:hypothetical protein